MGRVVASDKFVHNQTDNMKTELNSGHNLKLFKDSGLTVTPGTARSAFTIPTGAWYAAVSLAGDFTAPVQVVAGEYQFDSGVHTYTYSGSTPETIYGWWIDDGTNWKLAANFAAGVAMDTGVSFTLQVSPQGWALSLT